MKSPVIKRSVVIAKHKTSVSVEDVFWASLKKIAVESGSTLSTLIGRIDHERATGNLSSAIRTFVLRHYRRRCGEAEMKPEAAGMQFTLAGTPHARVENAAAAARENYGGKFDGA